MDVRDKVVAITGAARGLGQEFARTLAAAGARVVVGDLSDCGETLALVKDAGPEGLGVRLDVTDLSASDGEGEIAAKKCVEHGVCGIITFHSALVSKRARRRISPPE